MDRTEHYKTSNTLQVLPVSQTTHSASINATVAEMAILKWQFFNLRLKVTKLFVGSLSSHSSSSSSTTAENPQGYLPTLITIPDTRTTYEPIMTITTPTPVIDVKTEENWDDDFEFDNDDDDDTQRRHENDAPAVHLVGGHMQSLDSGAGRQEENWDDDFPDMEDRQGRADQRSLTVESRPSTSRSDLNGATHTGFISRKVTENWDEDFVDEETEMNDPGPSSRPQSRHQEPRRSESDVPENWDAEFEEDAPVAGPSTALARGIAVDPFTSGQPSFAALWDRQVLDTEGELHNRSQTPGWSINESRSELGIPGRDADADADDEDKTMTRRRPRHLSAIIPPLPSGASIPPKSPTVSEFSMPRTMSGSIYSSTGLLAYKSTPTVMTYSHATPPNPPQPQRPRRRLKKKQRPFDDPGVHELQDRIVETEEPELPGPSTPPRSPTPLNSSPAMATSSPASPGSKSIISLARMGSVKKWRRNRASTGPSEVVIREEYRPSTPVRPASSSWFLKAVGSPDLKRLRSKDHLHPRPDDDEKTPKARATRPRSSTTGAAPGQLPTVSILRTDVVPPSSDSRRPVSMQPPSRPVFPRLASQGEPATIGRSTSIKLQRPISPVPEPKMDKEGRRGFMGGVRRLSLVGRHKKARSVNEVSPLSQPVADEVKPVSHLTSPVEPNVPLLTVSALSHRADSPLPTTQVLSSIPTSSQHLQAPSSPQASSLGRVNSLSNGLTSIGLRRSSLGDLKIPSRISRAQSGIKRDLSMVREFATYIEHLKQLQASYTSMVIDIEDRQLDAASRSTSPIQYHLPRPPSRAKTPTVDSTTSKALHRIELQYCKWWEAAEVLINLGGSAPDHATSPPPSANASGILTDHPEETPVRRDRAVTLESPPPSVSPNSRWKGSTSKHDLSDRQLVILKEMLDTPNPNELKDLPEVSTHSLVRQYPVGSTATLPSEENAVGPVEPHSKKRRGSRLRGLKGIFRSLGRPSDGRAVKSSRQPSDSTMPPSNSSTSGFSSTDGHVHLERSPIVDEEEPHIHFLAPHSNHGADVRKHPNSPYGTTPSVTELPTKSPRRPSLASIFRIGHKPKVEGVKPKPEPIVGYSKNSLTDDEEGDLDWEHLSDSSPAQRKKSPPSGTVREKKREAQSQQHTPQRKPSKQQVNRPRTPGRQSVNASQVSLREGIPRIMSEQIPSAHQRSQSAKEDNFGANSGSVRSAPPSSFSSPALNSDPRLLLTPENIQPLLGYARKVHAELSKCIGEVQVLLPAIAV